MKPTARKGDLVQVTFLDHVEDSDKDQHFTFVVWGRVRSVTKSAITVECWAYPDPAHTEGDDDRFNVKRFTILKAVITDLVKLEAKRC